MKRAGGVLECAVCERSAETIETKGGKLAQGYASVVQQEHPGCDTPPFSGFGKEGAHGCRGLLAGTPELFLCGFGHDVAGVGGEAGAFELDGDVVDGEGFVEFCADGGEDGFTLVHVHIGDAGVATERIVIAAERPD